MFRSPKDVSVKILDGTSNVEVDYYCDLCQQGPWSNESDVDIHRKKAHRWHLMKTLKDKKCHMCSICLRHQKDRRSLIEHILVYHFCSPPDATRIDRQIFICHYCNNLFFNKQLLVSHISHWHIKSTGPEPQMINCPKCNKIIRVKSLWFHLLYHGVCNTGACPICLKPCDSNEEMIKHLKVHPRHFFCEICGYETTKECYLNKHMDSHKKKSVKNLANNDIRRFFLPRRMSPSMKNCMCHIFKGIPLSNAVHICVMCRALCVTKKAMRQHIHTDHAPEEEVKSKTHMCTCGQEFFNAVLLKHHIFKMKAVNGHRVWDGVTSISEQPIQQDETEVVYEIYEISNQDSTEINKIFISGLPNSEEANVAPITINIPPMES